MAKAGGKAEIPEDGFKEREQLEAWLKDQPREVSVAIAWRSIARIFPLMAGQNEYDAVLIMLRAIMIGRLATWVSYRNVDLRQAAIKLQQDCRLIIGHKLSVTADDLITIAVAVPFTVVRFDFHSYTAQNAADIAQVLHEKIISSADIWEQITNDAGLCEARGILAVNEAPLWFVDLDKADFSKPVDSAEDAWVKLRRELRDQPRDHQWSVWIDWYDDILHGKLGPTRKVDIEFARLFGHPDAGVEITEDDWKAGPSVVNPKIRQVLDWFASKNFTMAPLTQSDVLKILSVSELVKFFLSDIERPAKSKEIRDFVLSNRPAITPKTITDQISRLNTAGVIEKVAHATYRIANDEEIVAEAPSLPQVVAEAKQLSSGAVFERIDGHFKVKWSEDLDDQKVAERKSVKAELEEIKYRADRLVRVSERVTNQQGWEDFHDDVSRFVECVAGTPSEVAEQIAVVWARLVTLGGYLELDNTLRSPQRRSNASSLDEDVRRPLTDLVRTAAPWVREFPTARSKDDGSGSFLTKPELFAPIGSLYDAAAGRSLLLESDVAELKQLLRTVARGDFQAQKAASFSKSTARNLIVKAAQVVGGAYLGAAMSTADLEIVSAGGRVLKDMENTVIQIMADAPEDLQFAVREIIDKLPDDPEGPLLPNALPPERRQR